MNSAPFLTFVPTLLLTLPILVWYVAVLVLLYRILQELKRIRG